MSRYNNFYLVVNHTLNGYVIGPTFYHFVLVFTNKTTAYHGYYFLYKEVTGDDFNASQNHMHKYDNHTLVCHTEV